MRAALILLLLMPLRALAQSGEVAPGELRLSVEVDPQDAVPLVGEQVLITIRGLYRRHITRETLEQPALDGFSWAQLGPDNWEEARVGGQRVKTFTRRMALYPDRAGTLEIGPFTHKLTLTDAGDDWFEHEVRSAPVSLEVAPAPAGDDWWFPVRRLRISDQWSNAPDQLKPGDGVLRIVRLEALGVTPEMIPPMPDLTSPSAMIFPHPERRLVELTSEGPVTHAYWRWTIRPTNDVSAIVEPITVRYFDTTERVAREAVISPQRVAYGDVLPEAGAGQAITPPPASRLPGWPVIGLGLVTFAALIFLGARDIRFRRGAGMPRLPFLDPLTLRLRAAARSGDARRVRRLAHRLVARSGRGAAQLSALDLAIYDPKNHAPDLPALVRTLLREQHS